MSDESKESTSVRDRLDAAKEADRRIEERRREQEDAAREVADRRRVLDDAEKRSAPGQRDLDAERVGQIRHELAKGGDDAVRRRFGGAAVKSPEAAKARAQQRSAQRRGREAMERGVDEARSREASRTPLRDAAVKQQQGRERERDTSRGR
ncbi:hypothetical protein Gbro_0558 [Gordonia bronchialis DSM 43247]|uniref:Uncharacterized protein n=1 Tax=Gordonia bronchialis (strain ATCC 25592 / DSM 43247 / BCRC 13721 / JCM 3198 / KCTC 3076 / NBRC 16047 / NCTC 10667) TaxID=526226 RepID=D0LEH0_GORB4|nr:hypothetical protein [Gordonia bronchialis]ACY19888.1 hypothetical protein Gbro_0558 [Gordonia bronchialis DSM 43247]MCC3322660.1 hypothetical protein [Gordonia bronchialis]QGS26245.1 hypothetical protein FOB84_21045 [Gordonia bronchialis]STQ62665.1 Uncharacterised protein [Gordonia bronchialis]